jgi:hypothetical protein
MPLNKPKVYGHEIKTVVDMVYGHRPLDEIEAFPCPRCGHKLSLVFFTDGSFFYIQCAGCKMSKRENIPTPPDWWRQRVGDFGPVTYFYPRMSGIASDGTISMRVVWWNDEGVGNGIQIIRPDSQDYTFWQWIVAQHIRWPRSFSDRELPRLREEFTHGG